MATTQFDRKVFFARAVIWTENLSRALLRPVLVIFSAWLLILLNIPQGLGLWGKLAFWLIGFGLFGYFIRGLNLVRWPSRDQALQRIEGEAGLPAYGLRGLEDDLASGDVNLWAAYQDHLKKNVPSLPWLSYRPEFARQDPIALRNGFAIALIAIIGLQGMPSWRDWQESLPGIHLPVVQIDGWIAPPDYIQSPPILLAKGEVFTEKPIQAPTGSKIILQVDDPHARLYYRGELMKLPGASIMQSGDLVLVSRWHELARWQVNVTPDLEPEVGFNGEIKFNPDGSIRLPYQIADDYGVALLDLTMSLSDQQVDGEGILGFGPFLAPPPHLKISIPGDGKKASAVIDANLTRHPWAGLYVEARLLARDGAGQSALSKPLRFLLPERPFNRLVARALIEQRRWLLRDPSNQPRVVAALDAMSRFPDQNLSSSANWLELRAITRKLYRAQDELSVFHAAEDLWNFALRLDQGINPDARAALEKARDELKAALQNKASEDLISQKLANLQKAIQDYLRAMADAARRGELPDQRQSNSQSRQISPQDLNNMLQELGKMAREGELQAAEDALAALDQLLQNLQMQMGEDAGSGSQGNQAQQGQAQALKKLRELQAQQQKLMDETYRSSADQGDQLQGYSQEQQDIKSKLQKLIDEFANQGFAVPDGLNQAMPPMQDAQRALDLADRRVAVENQGRALELMRQAQQSLMQSMTGQVGPQAAGGKDPLNRDRGSVDQGLDREYLQGQGARKMARDILDELRRKRGLPGLNQVEEDYLDRLMRGLY